MAEIDFAGRQVAGAVVQGAELNVSLVQDDGTGVVINNVNDAITISPALALAGTDTRPRHWSAKDVADVAKAGGASVADIASLRLKVAQVGATAVALNHTSGIVGGGGLFEALAAVVGVIDDNGINIVGTGVNWVRSGVGNKWDMRWFGTAHDGIVDDSLIWQAVIDALSLAGGGILNVGAPLSFIDSNVRVRDRVTLNVAGRIHYGSRGRLSVSGAPLEIVGGSTAILAAIPVGATVIPVLNVTGFIVGMYVKIRGNRDKAGVSGTVEQHRITAVDAVLKTLTFSRPTKSAFSISWATSPFAIGGGVDNTAVSPMLTTALTTNVLRGDDTITVPVAQLANFALDDVMLLSDEEMGADALNLLNPSHNLLHQEMVVITAINAVTGVLTLEHKVHHGYNVAFGAAMTPSRIVRNAKVLGAIASYTVLSTTQKHAFEISFSRNCLIHDCHVEGSFTAGLGNVGHGFRVDVGLGNTVSHCSVRSAQLTGPAQGYGFSLYGATGCKLIHNFASGCRHSFILFKGAAGNLVQGNTSYGCMNSDYDLHGSNEIDNIIEDNIGIGTTRITVDSSGHGMIRVGNPYHIYGSFRNTIRNNTGYNMQDIFIDVQVASKDNVIEHNTVHNCDIGIKLSLPGSTGNGGLPRDLTATATGNIIRCNTIDYCRRGIDVNGQVNQTLFDNDLSSNKILHATDVAVQLIDAPNNDLSNVEVAKPLGNTVNSKYALRLIRSNNTTADGFKAKGTVAGIYLASTNNFFADTVVFDSLTGLAATDYTLRVGGGLTGIFLTNYLARNYTPKWSISGASTTVATAADTAPVSISAAQTANILLNNAKVSDINHVASLLPNVNNTSDVNKPVSTAQATAIGLKIDTSQKGVANGVAGLNAASELSRLWMPQGLKRVSTNLPADYALQTWSDALEDGHYNVHLTVAQNGLPAGWWYIDVQRHSNDMATNQWRTITAKSFGVGGNTPNQIYTSTCSSGAWTLFRRVAVDEPLTWITPTFVNGWADFGLGLNCRYAKDSGGTVFIKGLVKGGSNLTNTGIFTLPIGMRPSTAIMYSASTYGGSGRLDIHSDGIVSFTGIEPHTGNATAFLSVSATFKAEQ